MNEIKIEDLKQAIDQFAKVCYIMGKKEGLEGILEESPDEIRTIPLEALKEIIEEIKKPDISNNESDILKILTEQSQKLNDLMEVVKNSKGNTVIYTEEDRTTTRQNTIEMQDSPLVNLLKVDTSDIISQGSVGEIKSEGISVKDKIKRLKERLENVNSKK